MRSTTSLLLLLGLCAFTSAKDCKYTPNVDYTTTSGGSASATSKADCCAKCQAVATCKVGVYQPKGTGGVCYLKGGTVQPKPKPGVTACVAREPPPPAPAFDCASSGANCAGRLGATHWWLRCSC